MCIFGGGKLARDDQLQLPIHNVSLETLQWQMTSISLEVVYQMWPFGTDVYFFANFSTNALQVTRLIDIQQIYKRWPVVSVNEFNVHSERRCRHEQRK